MAELAAARVSAPWGGAASPVATRGPASGGVRLMLRLEGLTVLVGAGLAYAQYGAGWGLFALLFLLPDLSMLGYLGGARVGALSYNAAHSYPAPALLIALGALATQPLALAVGLIGLAHIGFDRALGYGLKYGTGFRATHLGTIGHGDPW